MIGWLIVFAILFCLATLPLGILVCYEKQPLVKVIVGFIRLTVFPLPKWMKRQKKENAEKPPQQSKVISAEKNPEHASREFADFIPFIQLGIDFMNAFRRKLRIQQLNVKVIMAGDDPCDLAVNYGRAWAAAGNLISLLERVFVIKKRDIEMECDFTTDRTVFTAKAEFTITLGRLLTLAVIYGIRAIREYLSMKKKHEKAVQTL